MKKTEFTFKRNDKFKLHGYVWEPEYIPVGVMQDNPWNDGIH